MDLLKEWQQLHQQKFNYSPIEKETIMKAIYQESNSTISTLKKRLKFKLYWILFFLVAGGIWMLCSLDRPELLMIQGLIMTIYMIGLVVMGLIYRKMDTHLDFTDQTLPLMKKQNQLITNALNFEKYWGLAVYPIAAFIGLLISNHYKGKSISAFVQDPNFLLLALVLIVIMTPILYFISNKMNQSAYGKLTDTLQNNIRRMEDLA